MLAKALKIWLVMTVLMLLEGGFPANWWRPDFALLFLVPWALRSGARQGAVLGFCLGVTLAVLSGAVVGVFGLVYGVTGFALGWWGEREVPGFFVEVLGMVFAVAAVEVMLVALARLIPWPLTPSLFVLHSWLVPTLIVNVALLWPADKLVAAWWGAEPSRNRSWRI